MEKVFFKKNLVIILFSLFFLFFSLPKTARAAFLYFSPSQGNFYTTENFTVNVLVNADVSINATEGTVIFPTEFLETISLNNKDSILNLWIQEPSFSNAGQWGNARFEGIVLNPGFKGPAGKIIEIVFRVKKEGSADLSFTDFAILANDGLGTNVSTPNGKAHFSLLAARIPPEEKESLPKEDIKAVEEKIKSVEKKIETVPAMEEKVKLVEEKIQALGSLPVGIIRFWNALPEWLKISVFVLVGITIFILLLIVLSLGTIILIWLWSRAWRQKKKFITWLESLPKILRRVFNRASDFLIWAGKEFAGDVRYSLNLMKRGFKKAAHSEKLKKVLKNYKESLVKIIRRFQKRNVPLD